MRTRPHYLSWRRLVSSALLLTGGSRSGFSCFDFLRPAVLVSPLRREPPAWTDPLLSRPSFGGKVMALLRDLNVILGSANSLLSREFDCLVPSLNDCSWSIEQHHVLSIFFHDFSLKNASYDWFLSSCKLLYARNFLVYISCRTIHSNLGYYITPHRLGYAILNIVILH